MPRSLLIAITILVLLSGSAILQKTLYSTPTPTIKESYTVRYDPESLVYTYTDTELGFRFQFPKTSASIELEDSTGKHSDAQGPNTLRILTFCTPPHCLTNTLFVEKATSTLNSLSYPYLYAPESQLSITNIDATSIDINGINGIYVIASYEGVEEQSHFIHVLSNGYIFTWRTTPSSSQNSSELTHWFRSTFELL